MKDKVNHVALVIGSMRMGGAERASVNLINEFAERGIRCDLVLVHTEGEFLSELHPDVNIVPLGGSRTIFSGFSLRRYLRRIQPQIIIAGQTHVQLLTLWARKGSSAHIPVILNEHSTFSSNHTQTSYKGRVIYGLSKRWFPRAEAITAVSEGVKEDLINEFPALKSIITVIYNPVVTHSLIEKSLLEVELPWKDEFSIPVILAAGRLVAEKDFSTLVNAVAVVRKTMRVRLVILGEGQERAGLLEQAERLGFENDISLYGYTKNPYAWMRKAEVFVLSSRREGLPMALIEALACGCTVVSTDCKSGPREILQNGKFGILVPLSDPDALAKAILSSLVKPLYAIASNEAVHPYEVSTVCEQYLELMNSLLDKRKKS